MAASARIFKGCALETPQDLSVADERDLRNAREAPSDKGQPAFAPLCEFLELCVVDAGHLRVERGARIRSIMKPAPCLDQAATLADVVDRLGRHAGPASQANGKRHRENTRHARRPRILLRVAATACRPRSGSQSTYG